MEEKFGKLEGELKMLPLASVGQIIIGVIFAIAGVVALIGSSVVSGIVLLLIGVAFLAYCIRLITYCRVALHENGIVIYQMFKTLEIPLDTVFAIYWDFPGQNTINSRGPNKNVTTAEILLENGQCAYRITSGIYRDVEDTLGAYQASHSIQKDLEKKGKNRYNYTLE